MNNSIIVNQPSVPAQQLVLVFHGVASTAAAMETLAQHAASALPQAMVVCVNAASPADFGRGRQWFSIQGVTEANRQARIDEAIPAFADSIRYWQQQAKVTAAETLLIGFSQGSIMALESTQLDQPLANKIIAIAGRFALPPQKTPNVNKIYLLHGDQDAVIATDFSRKAVEHIQQLGGSVTLDLFAGLGHGIDNRVLERMVECILE